MTTSAVGGQGHLGESDDGEYLLTGEAVALELPPASLGVRAIAGMIDMAVVFFMLPTVLFAVFMPLANVLDQTALTAVFVPTVLLVVVGFPTILETLTGRTVAKMILGLRTLRDDGGPISFRHAFTRHMVGLVEVYLLMGAPALVSGLLNTRAKRLGDFAAGTYVVRDRMTFPWPTPAAVPLPLAAWASTADIAPLPDQLSLSIRELLRRAPQIRPEPRHQLAQHLAAQALVYVSPGPPLGTPPEVFLEAVLVERGRRDWERLQRDEEIRRRLTGRGLPVMSDGPAVQSPMTSPEQFGSSSVTPPVERLRG
ncbi:RDD family protein [Austwickia chelonae]|uniref:RDD family protein n=1 Tax=Austwickia chelonae TaxID=100225 RepID=UPI0019687380|nr:RDD family protein [Austwickia chelonae]